MVLGTLDLLKIKKLKILAIVQKPFQAGWNGPATIFSSQILVALLATISAADITPYRSDKATKIYKQNVCKEKTSVTNHTCEFDEDCRKPHHNIYYLSGETMHAKKDLKCINGLCSDHRESVCEEMQRWYEQCDELYHIHKCEKWKGKCMKYRVVFN